MHFIRRWGHSKLRDTPFLCSGHIERDHGEPGGVSPHEQCHPAVQEASHQVRPAGDDRQGAHPFGGGVLLCLRTVRAEEEALLRPRLSQALGSPGNVSCSQQLGGICSPH